MCGYKKEAKIFSDDSIVCQCLLSSQFHVYQNIETIGRLVAHHARTDANMRTHPREVAVNACTHTPHMYTSPYCQPWRPTSLGDNSWSLAIEINTGTDGPVSPRFCVFFAYKKMLGQTDMRTRERMYCQTIWTVRDISRDDRAKIATCSLRTLKKNYSIDGRAE